MNIFQRMGRRAQILSFISLAAAGGLAGGCLGSGDVTTTVTGPIDGTYVVSSISCNGTAASLGATAISLVVANTAGSFSESTVGCVKSTAQTLTYPSSTTLTLLDGAVTCTPSECGGSGNCTTDTAATAQTYTYSLSGSTLTLTRTDTAGDICTAGQEAVIVMTKQ